MVFLCLCLSKSQSLCLSVCLSVLCKFNFILSIIIHTYSWAWSSVSCPLKCPSDTSLSAFGLLLNQILQIYLHHIQPSSPISYVETMSSGPGFDRKIEILVPKFCWDQVAQNWLWKTYLSPRIWGSPERCLDGPFCTQILQISSLPSFSSEGDSRRQGYFTPISEFFLSLDDTLITAAVG